MVSQPSISFLVMHKVSCRFLILRKCSTFLCTRWGWYPRTGKGQRLMVKEAVIVSIFGWHHSKVKSTKINPPLQGTRL